MAVNRERLIHSFTDLTRIDTVSFKEREMKAYLQKVWGKLGIDLIEDDAAAKIGGNAGNLFGTWKSDDTSCKDYVLFCAHQDTVQPGTGKKAKVQADGRITSDGTTVLGADDAAALAMIYEAVQELMEEGASHKNVELLFPVAEEAYTVGSSAFDFSKVHAKVAYCPDLSDRLGSYSAQEPTLISFRFTLHGRAAHAGFEPEKGINTIAAAAAAIARIPQGRPDDHSTLNFGTIHGGVTTNVVAEETLVEGEIRSAVHEDALKLYEQAAAVFTEEAEKIGASFSPERKIHLHAYQIPADDPALARYKTALEKHGIEVYAKKNFGGSDCNVLRRKGIHGLCVFNSMHACHTTKEYAVTEELVQMTEVIKELMRAYH